MRAHRDPGVFRWSFGRHCEEGSDEAIQERQSSTGLDCVAYARNDEKAQPTVSLFFEVYSEPSSSFQVKVNSPDSVALKKNDW